MSQPVAEQNERPLTTAQVAQEFSVHVTTVTRWAEDGVLPFFRTPGGHRRFHRADVEALMAKGRVA